MSAAVAEAPAFLTLAAFDPACGMVIGVWPREFMALLAMSFRLARRVLAGDVLTEIFGRAENLLARFAAETIVARCGAVVTPLACFVPSHIPP